MDIDPLQDTLPPRYALESDSEDEALYPGVLKRQTKPPPQYEVTLKWVGAPPGEKRTLVVGIGEPGAVWGKGLRLGDKLGDVLLNEEEIATVYRLGQAVLVLLEQELPIYAMYKFAETVLRSFKPSSVTMIDAYSNPGYISSSPPTLDPPIRFLATGSHPVHPKSTALPFAPPNLLLSPSAAFLSLLEATTRCPGLLLLLPLPRIPRPAPHSEPEPIRMTAEWPVALLEDLNALISAEEGVGNVIWDAKTMAAGLKTRAQNVKKVKPKDVLESGMYI